MSYSFVIKAESKADGCNQIKQQFDDVVVSQPSHAADKDAGVAAAQAFVGILQEPESGNEVYVTVYGSLSWNNDAPDKFTQANISISASVRAKT